MIHVCFVEKRCSRSRTIRRGVLRCCSKVACKTSKVRTKKIYIYISKNRFSKLTQIQICTFMELGSSKYIDYSYGVCIVGRIFVERNTHRGERERERTNSRNNLRCTERESVTIVPQRWIFFLSPFRIV